MTRTGHQRADAPCKSCRAAVTWQLRFSETFRKQRGGSPIPGCITRELPSPNWGPLGGRQRASVSLIPAGQAREPHWCTNLCIELLVNAIQIKITKRLVLRKVGTRACLWDTQQALHWGHLGPKATPKRSSCPTPTFPVPARRRVSSGPLHWQTF